MTPSLEERELNIRAYRARSPGDLPYICRLKSIRSARNLGYYRKRSNKFSYITLTRGMHRHLEMSMLRAHGCLGDAVTSIGFIVVLVDN
jgi:hypothetical protein